MFVRRRDNLGFSAYEQALEVEQASSHRLRQTPKFVPKEGCCLTSHGLQDAANETGAIAQS